MQGAAPASRDAEKLRYLMAAITDHLLFVTNDATIVDLNHTPPELAKTQMLGTTLYDHLPLETHENLRSCLAQVTRDGSTCEFHLDLQAPAGPLRHYHCLISPWTQDGVRSGAIMHARDITEQINAYKLADEAQCLAKLGHWELDLRTNHLTWSDEIFRIFEREPRSFGATYEAFLSYVHPEDRDLVNQAYTHSVQARTPYNIVHRLLLANDRIKYVNERCQTHYDAQGKPIRSLGTVQDITENRLIEQALQESEHFNRLLFDSLPMGLVLCALDGRLIDVNPAFAAILGRSVEDALALSYWDITPEKYADQEQLQLHSLQTTGRYGPYEKDYIHKDGHLVPVRLAGRLVTRGGEQYIWSSAEDITTRKRVDDRLRQAAIVFEQSGEGVIITDEHCRIQAVNHAFVNLSGYTTAEVVGREPALLLAESTDQTPLPSPWAALHGAQEAHWQGETWLRRRDGRIFPAWMSITAVHDEHAALTHYIATFNDITEKKAAEQRIEFLAHHDPLTALPNRLMFNERLNHAMQRARRDQQQLGLLFIDLDEFKHINDSLGHAVGDQLLQEVAARLQLQLREMDTLARLGGDEFVILLEEVREHGEVVTVAEKLLRAAQEPCLINEHDLYITLSIGISLYPNDGSDVESLIRNADAAMYRAKAKGRNTYQFYTERLTRKAVERLTLATQLRKALECEEFILQFQPVVRLSDGVTVGAEALLRWQHPHKGLICPRHFIGLAEETGLIVPIGAWVLQQACAQLSRWQHDGIGPQQVAVNISSLQLERGALLPEVEQALRTHRLKPGSLELEITESVMMADIDQTLVTLEALRGLDVTLALDDFGTGHSSLAYLKRLPIQRVKIDQSFVRDIPRDGNDCAISRAIIALAETLQMETVAEGIETQEQLEFLRRHHCDLGQGWLYSEPLDSQRLASWHHGDTHPSINATH